MEMYYGINIAAGDWTNEKKLGGSGIFPGNLIGNF